MDPWKTSRNHKAILREQSLVAIRTKLAAAGIAAHECTAFHFKYGALNFYPTSGKIHRDGNADAYRATGVDAFIKACQNEDAGLVGDPFEN